MIRTLLLVTVLSLGCVSVSQTTFAAKSKAPASRPAAKAKAAKAPAKPATRKSSLAPIAPADSMLSNILQSRTVRVCVRSDIPPLSYFKGETLQGFDIALAKQLVARISIRYRTHLRTQWVIIKAAERVPNLQKGRCDMVVAAFSKTKARAKKVAFTQMYYQTNKVVLRKKYNLSSAPVIATVRSTTQGAFSLPHAVQSSFLSYSDILYTMRQELVDYVITDYPIGLYLVRHSDAKYQIHRTLKNQESYSVGVNLSHKHLLAELERALTFMKTSGQLGYLQRQWLQ